MRIREPKYGKEGDIRGYTRAGLPIVEWANGGVSVQEGEYDVLTCAACGVASNEPCMGYEAFDSRCLKRTGDLVWIADEAGEL